MAEFDRLIKRAREAAGEAGGLTAILLATRNRQLTRVTYDPDRARFLVNGKEVSVTRMTKELRRLDTRLSNLVADYARKLWSREWTLAEWRREMEKLLEGNSVMVAALAWGGFRRLRSERDTVPRDLIERRLGRDLRALEGYTQALRNQTVPSERVSENRSRAYVRSMMVLYHVLSQRAHIAAGYEEARRVLSAAEHCRTTSREGVVTEGCLEVAARGWMPIRQMPPIGNLTCRQYCRCRIEYR